MKKSQILKLAKKYLSTSARTEYGPSGWSKQKFICWSLEETQHYDSVPHKEVTKLERWIERDLMGFKPNSLNTSLEYWLSVHHPEFNRRNGNKMQTLRHKWIDWMIQYWEAKGE